MEIVNNYLPGDSHLVDKIVYELKAQGIFDQFRKECFADVDTKPAYQNLRQRVEGSVAAFLKDQSWRPDMNKNQVREMLRKTITESGYLETGVERIVNQVVNPKINTVFLPKVEEVVCGYLGVQKPNRGEQVKKEPCDLLPKDLEAVSPESESMEKKDERISENVAEMDETKTEEDESPPFEPLEEQSYMPQEENSVDSHMSGFSGLASHESNQSNENKIVPMEQDSQMSRNSSDSRLSIVTSDENSKMEISEDSQSRSMKGSDSNSKPESEKSRHKSSSDKHKSRIESRHDKDRRSSKDSKTRLNSTSKEKRDEKKDSKSSSKTDKSKDRDRKSSTSKHSSHTNKDKNGRRDSSRSDKDKKSNSHKDPKPKSSDSRSKDKSSSSDKHKHSSSSHKRDKDKKKDSKPKDDHYNSRDKKNDRRSTDRDSNDGQSGRPNQTGTTTENSNSSQGQKSSQESNSGGGDVSNADHDNTTKAPVVITGLVENAEVLLNNEKPKVFKPKYAANMKEAMKLMKIRKQLAKLEKNNQLGLASVDLGSSILQTASIDLEDIKKGFGSVGSREVEIPLQNTVISQDSWDAMEEKLRKEVCSEFKEHSEDSMEEENERDKDEFEEDCKYFEPVDPDKSEFLVFIKKYIRCFEEKNIRFIKQKLKRKIEETVLKNNNNHLILEKRPKLLKKNKAKLNHTTDSLVSERFPLPLSPAESEKSLGKKDENSIIPTKVKRNSINKVNSQRYSSDDLYKPRPTFASSRRRGAKNLDN